MSFNPQLGDLGNSSSWETISSNSSNGFGAGSSSSVFFGGAQHTFAIFSSGSSSSDITSGGKQSSLSSFGQGAQRSVSLPDMAENVEHSFEEKGLGDSTYDPSELVGRSVSLDSGLDKTSKDSKASKIKRTVGKFFKSSPKAPSMKSFMASVSDFPDPYDSSNGTEKTISKDKESQKQDVSKSGGSKKTLGAKPKVPQKKTAPLPKKTGSFSGLKGIFKGSIKSKPKPKVPPKPPRSDITKDDISGPMDRPRPKRPAPQPPAGSKKRPSPTRPNVSPPPIPVASSGRAPSPSSDSVNPVKLEDQLKNVWVNIETMNPATYKWLGYAVLTQVMQQVEGLILKPGDKNVSITKIFTDFRSQCNTLISGNSEDSRAVLCAFLDKTITDPKTPFSELLEENEGSNELVELFRKIENKFDPSRMRLFLSALVTDMEKLTSANAKYLTTRGNSIDTQLGTSGVKSSLEGLNGLLQGKHVKNWSNSVQVLINDTFA